MTNHVHLLITPSLDDSILQHVGRIYVVYINKKHKRTGSLWEGRCRCSLVDTDEYLLSCYRYIELNPVVAGIIENPEGYRWSSYRANSKGKLVSLLSPHELYLGLGHDVESRCCRYRELFDTEISDKSIQKIRKVLNSNYPLGRDQFKKGIECYLGRPIGKQEGGRPVNVCRLPKDNALRPL